MLLMIALIFYTIMLPIFLIYRIYLLEEEIAKLRKSYIAKVCQLKNLRKDDVSA